MLRAAGRAAARARLLAKVPRSLLPGSLWVSGPTAVIDIDPAEIETLFNRPALVMRRKKPKVASTTAATGKPAPLVSLIDPKRAHSCGIALSRIRTHASDAAIRNALCKYEAIAIAIAIAIDFYGSPTVHLSKTKLGTLPRFVRNNGWDQP